MENDPIWGALARLDAHYTQPYTEDAKQEAVSLYLQIQNDTETLVYEYLDKQVRRILRGQARLGKCLKNVPEGEGKAESNTLEPTQLRAVEAVEQIEAVADALSPEELALLDKMLHNCPTCGRPEVDSNNRAVRKLRAKLKTLKGDQ